MKTILKLVVVALLIGVQPAIAQKGKGKGKGLQKKAEKIEQTVQKGKNEQTRPVEESTNEDLEEKMANKEKRDRKIREEKERERENRKDKEDDDYNDDDGNNDESKKPKKEKKIKVKENNGQGNAYGKNKGDLTGREFGQERARQAKLNKETKQEELSKVVDVNSEKTKTAREKVNEKLEELEKMKEKGEVSEKEYGAKVEKIEEVKKQIFDLEEKMKKAKQIVLEKNN